MSEAATLSSYRLPWFLLQVMAGIRYALYFAVIGFFMGAIYGVFGGMVWAPALFSVGIIGIFCILNFLVAILTVVVNVLLAVFRKSSRPVFRYFGLSLGFALVFLFYFYLLHLFEVKVF